MVRNVVIDLGCGFRKRTGAIGLDIAPLAGVDVRADVMRQLPIRDSCADEVIASHLVEHTDDLMAFMGEVWRICKPGALLYIRFPHGTSKYDTWRDPTHRRAVFLATFQYFDPNTLDGKLWGYYHPAKFEIVNQRINFNMNAEDSGESGPKRFRRLVGRVLDRLANHNARAQYFCERFWGSWLGMEEGHIWMRAIKPTEAAE